MRRCGAADRTDLGFFHCPHYTNFGPRSIRQLNSNLKLIRLRLSRSLTYFHFAIKGRFSTSAHSVTSSMTLLSVSIHIHS